MYAVIQTGGKQYKVEAGDTLKVEKLDTAEGKTVKLKDVLMLVDGDKITTGNPYIKGVTVSAKVNVHGRHGKIDIIKFKRRKNHRKHIGHRQDYTELSITGIKVK